MSSSAASIIYVGMDVHKDSITIAVLPRRPRLRRASSVYLTPSRIPKRPGVQWKHDKRDAADLAALPRR